MKRLAEERGMTLIELLLAATLTLVVTGATLTLLAVTARQQRVVEQHNEAQQQVRSSLDLLARDLRNLASPLNLASTSGIGCHGTRPGSVGRNLPYDLVYCAVADAKPASTANAANVKRVRYCLDSADPERGVIWQQTQTWLTATPPAMPSDTACPGANWNESSRIVSSAVVNRSGGRERPLFRYAGEPGAITGTDDASRGLISRVRADVYVDADSSRSPREAHLATAVFLRNQNREPVASFTIDVLNPVLPLLELNGTASQDPESQRLRFQFYVDPPSPLPDCDVPAPHASCIMPASPRSQITPSPGPHTFVLMVRDPANLRATMTRSYP